MKKLLLQWMGFCLLMAGLQYLTARLFPLEQPKDLRNLKLAIRAKPDVYFMGDSVMDSFDPADEDTRTIPGMLKSLLQEYRVVGVHRGGFHLRLYRDIARYIVNAGGRPRAMLIEINPAGLTYLKDTGSFEWTSGLFRQDQNPLLSIFFRPLAIFKWSVVMPPLSQARYLNQIVYLGDRPVGNVRDYDPQNKAFDVFSEENLRKKIILRYLGPLTPHNQYLRAIQQIAQMLQSRGIKPLFYITPVNHQLCERSMPGEFAPRLTQKTSFIRSLLAARKLEVLDLSFALPEEYFQVVMYPNEHLNERGRLFVAGQLADWVRKELGQANSPATGRLAPSRP